MLKKTIVVLTFCIVLFSSVYGQSALDLYMQGKHAQNREDWYMATELYLEALELNPSYGEAWLSLAECAYELDQYDLAVSYVDKAAIYIKNRVDIPNLKGFSLIGLGRLTEARQIFLETLARQPNDIEARFGLAQLDLFDGKFTGAENYFLDALKRDTSSKKALISLALIADEMGDTRKAQNYVKQAIEYHSDRADVYYFAGYLAAKENDLQDAENYIRTAIRLDGDYEIAYKLLADVLFVAQRYEETINVCDYMISQDRNNSSAWYIKGLAQSKLQQTEQALSSWEIGLRLNENDEIMRSAFEMYIYENVSIEDSRRSKWAEYHLEKADIARSKYLASTALYEYQRTLRLDPYNVEARLAYASILLQEGYSESYLSQLQFLQAQNLSTRSINDNIEAYASMLSNTLPIKWDVDAFYLDKKRWSIAFFHLDERLSLFHQDSISIVTDMVAETFNSNQAIEADSSNAAVSGFAQAFRSAREQGYDYFAIVDVSEGERDIRITVDLYLSAMGTKVDSWEVYRTGNDMLSSALQKISKDITNAVPKKGKIIDRRSTSILIDLGRKDGVEVDQVYEIYEGGDLALADSGLGLKYDSKDVLGTITITEVGEDIAQGVYKQNGFYDLVAIGDEVIPTITIEPEEITDSNTEVNPSVQAPEVNIDTQTTILYDLIDSIN